MRKIQPFLLTLPLFAITLTVQSQSNYQPGSVLLKNGQVINGLIDYREWRQNPKTISFKKEAKDQVLQYGVEELNGFMVNSRDSFEKAIVTKDMLPVDFKVLTDQSYSAGDTASNNQVDTVFLRILAKGGKVDLYELVDSKSHFYTKEPQGDYKELIYKVSYDPATGLLYSHIFRNQLQQYAYGHKEEARLTRLLESAAYNERDLLRIISVINNVQLQKKKSIPPQFFATAGPTYSSMKVAGTTDAAKFNYSGSLGYTAGIGMDIVSARNLQDFTMRLGLYYTALKYEGKTATATYTLRQNNITPALDLLYNFLRKPFYKVYFGGGLQYNFSSYPENEIVTKGSENNPRKDVLNFEKNWLGLTASIGGIINKIEVNMQANWGGSFERFITISVKPSIYSLKVAYRFGGK